MPAIRSNRPTGGPVAVRRWQELAVEWLDFPLGRFLDYGCGPGGLIEKLGHRCDRCHGVDVDEDQIRQARRRLPACEFRVIGLDGRTDYPDAYFDTIAILEVIEHVPDERATLAEVARILRPGGRLLLTTPHRGWLTFLDVGNFKFLFPRIHRFVHQRLKRNRQHYDQRFVRGKTKGLIGDISIPSHRRPWHRHYSPEQILSACPLSLTPGRFGVYFPGMRALMLLRVTLSVCTGGRLKKLPPPLPALERKLSYLASRGGDQLVMLLTKRDE